MVVIFNFHYRYSIMSGRMIVHVYRFRHKFARLTVRFIFATFLLSSFLENSKLKHRTLGNLSSCSEAQIQATRLALSVAEGISRLNTYCAVKVAGAVELLLEPRADVQIRGGGTSAKEHGVGSAAHLSSSG
jgi:hypothetical protein